MHLIKQLVPLIRNELPGGFQRGGRPKQLTFRGHDLVPVFSLLDAEIGRYKHPQRFAHAAEGLQDSIDLARQSAVVKFMQTPCAQALVAKHLMRATRPCDCIQTLMCCVQQHQLHR